MVADAFGVHHQLTLTDSWKKLQHEGPSHILLNRAGDTEMMVVAKSHNPDLSWDLVYIRNDGFTLACDFYLAQYAEALHRNDWTAVLMRGELKPRELNFRA